MGRVYARPLHHDGYVFGCACCKTPFAKRSDLINPHFRGRTGAAWLFDKVINVNSGEPEQAEMTTGPHRIRPIFCVQCQISVGWLYESAFMQDQRYKEGKFILEKAMLLEWIGQSASKIRGPCGPGLEKLWGSCTLECPGDGSNAGGRGRSAVAVGAGAGDISCRRGTHADPAGNEIIVPAVPVERDAEDAGAGGLGGRRRELVFENFTNPLDENHHATNNGGQFVFRSVPPLAEGLSTLRSLSSVREDAEIPGARDSSVGGEENKDEEVEAMETDLAGLPGQEGVSGVFPLREFGFGVAAVNIEIERLVLASHRDTGHRDDEQGSTTSSSSPSASLALRRYVRY
eukprot:g1445.t1